jgi:hypothetical protein
MTKPELKLLCAITGQARRRGKLPPVSSDLLLQLAVRIARRYRWCDPKSVADRDGCASQASPDLAPAAAEGAMKS